MQPIRHPNSIVDDQPSKELAFWSGPNFPDSLHERSGGAPLELERIGRGRGVGTALRELPDDRILGVVVQGYPMQSLPEGGKLLYVIGGNAIRHVNLRNPMVSRERLFDRAIFLFRDLKDFRGEVPRS